MTFTPRAYGEPMEWGYDYAFVPVEPVDNEWRQRYAELQKRWLADWHPRPEGVN